MKTEIKCCRYVLSLEFRKTMCDPINTSPTIWREMCVLYVSGGNISCVLLLIRTLLHFTEYKTASHAATYTYVQEHWLRIRTLIITWKRAICIQYLRQPSSVIVIRFSIFYQSFDNNVLSSGGVFVRFFFLVFHNH